METLGGQRLVIFGCGYLGTALAHAAARGGARVTGLTRNPARAAELAAAGIEPIVAELGSNDWHARIAGGPDWVVNCVSASEFSVEAYRQAYVAGMESILAWARSAPRPIGTFVYTSSTGVYPQGGGVIVDESAPTDGAGPTGRVLAEAEQLLRTAPAAHVRRSFVLRLAGLYGPGRHALLDQLRSGAEVLNGRGGHRLNLVHRDDAAGAILACLRADASVPSATFNVCDGHPVARAELVEWLAARLGIPAPRFDPTHPGVRRGGAGVPDRIIRNEAIRRAVGWTPRYPSFREGYAAILGESQV